VSDCKNREDKNEEEEEEEEADLRLHGLISKQSLSFGFLGRSFLDFAAGGFGLAGFFFREEQASK
jgi:hypothetical protein